MIDGFPLESQRLTVVEWRKNHWVHQWFCEYCAEANECRDVHVDAEDLAKLADKLEKWVDDPETLPPISATFKGPFFGTHKTDPEYEQARDMYRAEAKDEAKMIRKAVSWLNDPPANPNVMTEYRHAVYRASW